MGGGRQRGSRIREGMYIPSGFYCLRVLNLVTLANCSIFTKNCTH